MRDARFDSLLRKIPVLLMVAPCLWATVVQVRGSIPTPVAPAPKRAALAFTQRLVDLGTVAPSEEVLAHFDFINRGEEAVKILELVPSCGCLQPTMSRKLYYPGQAGHFELRVQTANQTAGQKEYHVTVKYADPEPQEVDLTFRVNLPENQVFIRPRALAIYQLSDQPMREKVEIVDRRGKSLNIVRVDCTRSQVAQVEMGESDVDDNGHARNRLWVNVPGNLPEAKVHAMIRVYTDDPDYRMLRVPLIIESRRPQSMAGNSPSAVHDPHVRPAGAVEEPADDGEESAGK